MDIGIEGHTLKFYFNYVLIGSRGELDSVRWDSSPRPSVQLSHTPQNLSKDSCYKELENIWFLYAGP